MTWQSQARDKPLEDSRGHVDDKSALVVTHDVRKPDTGTLLQDPSRLGNQQVADFGASCWTHVGWAQLIKRGGGPQWVLSLLDVYRSYCSICVVQL